MNDENDIGIAVLLREAVQLRDVPSDSGHYLLSNAANFAFF
jgi:hypothetical protein